MSSAETLAFPPAAPRTSARLGRRAAALAARLADLLDQALPGPGEHTAASDFLRAMAQAAGRLARRHDRIVVARRAAQPLLQQRALASVLLVVTNEEIAPETVPPPAICIA